MKKITGWSTSLCPKILSRFSAFHLGINLETQIRNWLNLIFIDFDGNRYEIVSIMDSQNTVLVLSQGIKLEK